MNTEDITEGRHVLKSAAYPATASLSLDPSHIIRLVDYTVVVGLIANNDDETSFTDKNGATGGTLGDACSSAAPERRGGVRVSECTPLKCRSTAARNQKAWQRLLSLQRPGVGGGSPSPFSTHPLQWRCGGGSGTAKHQNAIAGERVRQRGGWKDSLHSWRGPCKLETPQKPTKSHSSQALFYLHVIFFNASTPEGQHEEN